MSHTQDGVRPSILNKYHAKLQPSPADSLFEAAAGLRAARPSPSQQSQDRSAPSKSAVTSMSRTDAEEQTSTKEQHSGYNLGELGVYGVMDVELFEWHSKAAVTPVDVSASDDAAPVAATPMMAAIVESKSTQGKFLMVVFYVDADNTRHTYLKLVITDDFNISVVPQGSLVLPGSTSNCIVLVSEPATQSTKRAKAWALAFPSEDQLAQFLRYVVFCKARAVTAAFDQAIIEYVEEEERYRKTPPGSRKNVPLPTPPGHPAPFTQDIMIGCSDANVVTAGDIVRIRYSVYLPSAASPRGGYGALLYEGVLKALYINGDDSSSTSSDYPNSRSVLHPAIESALHGIRRRSLRVVVIPAKSSLASIPSEWGVHATNSDVFVEIACTQHKAAGVNDQSALLLPVQRPIAVAAGPSSLKQRAESASASASSVLSATSARSSSPPPPPPRADDAKPESTATRERSVSNASNPAPYRYAPESLVDARVSVRPQAENEHVSPSPSLTATPSGSTTAASSHGGETVLDRIKRISQSQNMAGIPQLSLPPTSPGLRPMGSSSQPSSRHSPSSVPSLLLDGNQHAETATPTANSLRKSTEHSGLHPIDERKTLSSTGPSQATTPSESKALKHDSFVATKLKEIGVSEDIISRFHTECIFSALDVTLLTETELKDLLPQLGARRRLLHDAQEHVSTKPADSQGKEENVQRKAANASHRETAPPPPSHPQPQSQSNVSAAAASAVASLVEEAYERGRTESLQLAKEKIDNLKRTAASKFEELKTETDRIAAAAESRAVSAEARARAAEKQVAELQQSLEQALQEQNRLKELTRTYVGKTREERKEDQKVTTLHTIETVYSRLQGVIQPNDVYDGAQVLSIIRDQLKQLGNQLVQNITNS